MSSSTLLLIGLAFLLLRGKGETTTTKTTDKANLPSSTGFAKTAAEFTAGVEQVLKSIGAVVNTVVKNL